MRYRYLSLLVAATACGDSIGPGAFPDRPITMGLEDFVYEAGNGQRIPAQLGRLWLEVSAGVSEQAVWFVRLPATTDDPGPPFIYLAGGPGGSGIATGRGERIAYFNRLRDFGDVILYDQRGTGWSTPGLDCTGTFELPLERAIARSEAAALWSQQVEVCSTELRSRGIDLDSYNTDTNADDIEALRVALGIDQFILVGYSYGTHLALSYVRQYGERVARVILHGVEGPDHTLKLPANVQRQLEIIDSLAEASPRRNQITPFLSTLENLLTQLEAKPETVSVNDTLVVLGRFEAEVLVASGIGDRSGVEELPGIVQLVANAGWQPAGEAILELKRAGMNSGMSYAMDCASGASVQRSTQIADQVATTLLGDAINFPFPEICAGWNVRDLGDGFRSPVVSDVPILFVSGSIDGRTPKSNADEVALGFPNHRHLLVENAGHNELATNTQVISAIVAWLQGNDNVPETVQLPPLAFRIF